MRSKGVLQAEIELQVPFFEMGDLQSAQRLELAAIARFVVPRVLAQCLIERTRKLVSVRRFGHEQIARSRFGARRQKHR